MPAFVIISEYHRERSSARVTVKPEFRKRLLIDTMVEWL